MADAKMFRYQSSYLHLVYEGHINGNRLIEILSNKGLVKIGVFWSTSLEDKQTQVFLAFNNTRYIFYYKSTEGPLLVVHPEYLKMSTNVILYALNASRKNEFFDYQIEVMSDFVGTKQYYNYFEHLKEIELLDITLKNKDFFNQLNESYVKSLSTSLFKEIKKDFNLFKIDIQERINIKTKVESLFLEFEQTIVNKQDLTINKNKSQTMKEKPFDKNIDSEILKEKPFDKNIDSEILKEKPFDKNIDSEILKDKSFDKNIDSEISKDKSFENDLESKTQNIEFLDFEDILLNDKATKENFQKIFKTDKLVLRSLTEEFFKKNNIDQTQSLKKNVLRIVAMETGLKSMPRTNDKLQWLTNISSNLPSFLQQKYSSFMKVDSSPKKNESKQSKQSTKSKKK